MNCSILPTHSFCLAYKVISPWLYVIHSVSLVAGARLLIHIFVSMKIHRSRMTELLVEPSLVRSCLPKRTLLQRETTPRGDRIRVFGHIALLLCIDHAARAGNRATQPITAVSGCVSTPLMSAQPITVVPKAWIKSSVA